MEGVDYMQYKRVEDDLKPHNQETIKNVLKFFETSNKCCAIQATGTGKTFLILRLLEIYNDADKKAVIFAPNRDIIKQTKEKMSKYNLNNATFYTYQKLARMTDDEISNIKADLIVCDELHRTGAKTWGNKFEKMVNTHFNAKVFGVTATSLRCADGRDMAEEYFDGNRACDISLAEALVRGIIPVTPLYISALYTFDEEYKNASSMINKMNSPDEEKLKLQKELLDAKNQLDKSIGIPEIIKKHIVNWNGKYIIFCKDKKHLFLMKDIVVSWFRDAGFLGEIFEYSYYSNDTSVKSNLHQFKINNHVGLKLLFVIDKLNEGLHLKDIDGCLLLRTTTSNIIYYQQIGRVIDAGTHDKRIIFDLVNNFNNLKQFSFKREITEKIEERLAGKFSDCSNVFDVQTFKVIDYVQDCFDVFKKYTAPNLVRRYWTVEEDKILKEYYPIIGLDVSKYLVDRSGKSIQSRAYQLGLILSTTWTENEIEILKKYYATEGRDVWKRIITKNKKQCEYKAQRLKLHYRRGWDEIDINKLKEYYPYKNKNELLEMFPGRTWNAIATTARQNHIYRRKKIEWSDMEIKIIKEYYPKEGGCVLERLQGKTLNQLRHFVNVHNIKYKK